MINPSGDEVNFAGSKVSGLANAALCDLRNFHYEMEMGTAVSEPLVFAISDGYIQNVVERDPVFLEELLKIVTYPAGKSLCRRIAQNTKARAL